MGNAQNLVLKENSSLEELCILKFCNFASLQNRNKVPLREGLKK